MAKVRGHAELEAACKRIPSEVEQRLRTAVGDEGRAIQADERRAVPVVTGELRDGIEVVPAKGGRGVVVGPQDPKLFWAVWIEWGRSLAPAQPFATPAAERARSRWPKRAADAVRDAVGG